MSQTIVARHLLVERHPTRHRRHGKHRCRPGQTPTMRLDQRAPLHRPRPRPNAGPPLRRMVAAAAMLLIVSLMSTLDAAGGWFV